MQEVITFFLVDTIKILLLLFVMIALVGFLRTYISQKKVKKLLKGPAGLANLGASIFGSITPFCSCSSIPLFIGFLEAGVPLGVAFSFLITSPIVNEYLVILMLAFFGLKITALYVISGIIIGTVAGMILGKMKLGKYLADDLIAKKEKVCHVFKERIIFGLNEAWSITKKLWLWIIIGVGIGAIIHNYVPQEWITTTVASLGIFGVPAAVILGIPLYGSCAAIIPIAVALFDKGMPLGTALAFMMAISTLSLPEAVILRRAMKLQLIIIFYATVTVAIILTGYIFNL